MVRLKNGVTGFIYDSVYGSVKTVLTKPISELNLVWGEDDDRVLIVNENVNDLFEFRSKNDLENDVEGLSEVLEWVE